MVLYLLTFNFFLRNLSLLAYNVQDVQVGRMGHVPAYGGNDNSPNVSCSKPSLHYRYINGYQNVPLTLFICSYTNELKTMTACRLIFCELRFWASEIRSKKA